MAIEIGIDEYTDIIEEQCSSCKGKSIARTTCCSKKLCQFHLRFGIEDFGTLMECIRCITHVQTTYNERPAFYRTGGRIYCKEHMQQQLTFCEICENYFCPEHLSEKEKVEIRDDDGIESACGHGFITYPLPIRKEK